MGDFNKRACAVDWSVENIVKGKPGEGEGRRSYFWTLTTRDEADPSTVLKRWGNLVRVLRRAIGHLEFVRVIEPHKSGTRFHLHVIFPVYLPVVWFRARAEAAGFGRVHVVRVRDCGVGGYLAKYFRKADRNRKLHGVKMFGASIKNESWHRIRLIDVEYLEDGKPLTEECKKAVYWWKRPGQRKHQTLMEYFAYREAKEEWAYRAEFRAFARKCDQEGDLVGFTFWTELLEHAQSAVEYDFISDECGNLYVNESFE